MICPRCKAQLPAGSTSCPKCGARFTQGKRCPHCQTVISAQATVCPKCGKPVGQTQRTASSQPAPPAKGGQKAGFRWWYILIAVGIFGLGAAVGAIGMRQYIQSRVQSAVDQLSSLADSFGQSTSTPEEESSLQSEEEAESPQKTTFAIGETWKVDGQWELTVTGVTETTDRNEFSDKTPAAVYIVDFTYTNTGYQDDVLDGLFFLMDDTIVDSTGKMGYSYPGTVTKHPQSTPIGATCEGQVCIGVDNPGDFSLTVSSYDGNNEKQTATFTVSVN